MEYNKLSNLINQQITINQVGKFTWKKWENDKMLTSENYQEGFRKVYRVETDKGVIDISAHNIGQMLEGFSSGGQSNIAGKKFQIKSNGKTGKEIRYYINPVFEAVPVSNPEDDLPFGS